MASEHHSCIILILAVKADLIFHLFRLFIQGRSTSTLYVFILFSFTAYSAHKHMLYKQNCTQSLNSCNFQRFVKRQKLVHVCFISVRTPLCAAKWCFYFIVWFGIFYSNSWLKAFSWKQPHKTPKVNQLQFCCLHMRWFSVIFTAFAQTLDAFNCLDGVDQCGS